MRVSREFVLVGVAAVALLALVVLAYLAVQSYEVVDKGRLLPFPDSGRVYEIRLLDTFTVYVDPEARRGLDIVNVYLLAAVSGMALVASILLYRTPVAGGRRLMWFFVLTWLGAGFLAADEGLGLHGTVGSNLRFLADLPGIERPDNAVYASYAIPAAIFLVVFRDVILSSRKALALFSLGLGLFLLAALLNVVGGHADDVVEVVGAATLLGGFTVLTVESMQSAMTSNGQAVPGSEGSRG